MLAEVVEYLRCPICHGPLAGPGPLRCPREHSFDLARHGYVQLTPRPLAHVGDTTAMVAARGAFLDAGHYGFLSAALATEARAASTRWQDDASADKPLVLDVGAGTGHHLAAVLDALDGAVGLALDAAKPAARRAVNAHSRAAAVVCDTWQRLPIGDDAARLVLNVFAPRNGAEFRRVLANDGALLVATPTAGHLGDLMDRLAKHGVDLVGVDPDKETRLEGALRDFRLASERTLSQELTLTRAEAADLVAMGPSARHIQPALLAEALAALSAPIAATASIRLTQWTPGKTALSSP